jgi:hypothetical protein
VLDGVGGGRAEPVRIGLAPEILPPHPAGIAVGGLDANPLAAIHEHLQRLPAKSLRHLFGILRRRGAKGRELACERMFA